MSKSDNKLKLELYYLKSVFVDSQISLEDFKAVYLVLYGEETTEVIDADYLESLEDAKRAKEPSYSY